MLSSKTRSPWWVAGGQERCGFCAQTYVYEVEYRCVSCDAPVCPHCVVIVRTRRETYCPSCPPEHGTD
jgi:hypothetical protein